MCIAIAKPKGKTITKERLETCFKNNPDGCGFAYINGGNLYIEKFMEFEDFYKSYSTHEHDSNMLIHFRIATHGGVNLENCHPFKLNDRMALIHNGVLTGYGDRNSKSDTRDFIDKILSKISWKMWKNEAFRTLVGEAIGSSKFGVLDISGDMFIINKELGVVDDDVWYSNSSYKPRTTYKVTTKANNKDYDYSYYDWRSNWYNSDWYKKYYGDYKEATKDKQLPLQPAKKEEHVAEPEEVWGIVYQCKDCGKEFVIENAVSRSAKCPVCGKYKTEDIGWTENGAKFYYDGRESADKTVDSTAKV